MSIRIEVNILAHPDGESGGIRILCQTQRHQLGNPSLRLPCLFFVAA